jgi:enoyl-CoA hydratase
MDLELLEELVGVIEELVDWPAQAVVLHGTDPFFSAGLDLKALPGYATVQRRRMVDLINRMAIGAYEIPCPVVMAVTGHAIAGGFVLALAGDHRIVSTEGRHGLTEVKVGVPYPAGAIGVVTAELSAQAARVYVLGNRLTTAEEAVRHGAFDELAAPHEVMGRAEAVAGELAALPKDVYAATKAQLRGEAIAAMKARAIDDPMLATWLGEAAES